MSFTECMHDKGLPVPNLDGLDEFVEFIDNLHQAWDAAGGEADTTLAALVALGAVTGVDETILAAAGTVAVGFYIAACITCLASTPIDLLRDLFSKVELPSFMGQQFATLGVNLTDEAVA